MDVGLCCFPCVLNLYCVELHNFLSNLDNTNVLCALIYNNRIQVLDYLFGFGYPRIWVWI
jgi:hypothetical protein